MALSTITWPDKSNGDTVDGPEMTLIKTVVNEHAATLNFLLNLSASDITILKQLIAAATATPSTP